MTFLKDTGNQIVDSTIGQGMSLLFGGMQDDRQFKQQKRLWEEEMRLNKDMAKYNSDLSFENWLRTNYPAQVEQMKKAGLSISGMYEGGGSSGMAIGGTGSGVNGANAGDPNAGMAIGANIALMKAQQANIEADTVKKQAETANLTEAETPAKKWETELSKKLNTDVFINDVQKQLNWATERLKNTAQKEIQEWETARAAGFIDEHGKKYTFDDPESPMAKAMRAGFSKTVTELENMKKEGKILEAEKTVKEFEAKLTKQGIPAGSPWYVKLIADLLGKVGINLTENAEKK